MNKNNVILKENGVIQKEKYDIHQSLQGSTNRINEQKNSDRKQQKACLGEKDAAAAAAERNVKTQIALLQKS